MPATVVLIHIPMDDPRRAKYLVIGGGIAGVSCAETLSFYCPSDRVVLITESSLIKSVVNLIPLAKGLSRFDVQEAPASAFHNKSIHIIVDQVVEISTKEKCVATREGKRISYDFLCIASGSRPKLIRDDHPLVLGIRDTETVLEFDKRIRTAKKIVLVGNGGIASEIVFELRNLHIDWVIKDDHISSTFLDPGAAEFLKDRVNKETSKEEGTVKRMRFSEATGISGVNARGAALGPDWHRMLDMLGSGRELPEKVDIHYQCELEKLTKTDGGRLRIELSNGKALEDVDFVVSATGVVPRVDCRVDEQLRLAKDGGIAVDKMMRTSVLGVFAAGDCCTADWEKSEHWFQMRLWTQARQMGMMAGKSMAMAAKGNDEPVDEDLEQDFCFEFFGHVTELFGYQVVLLGRYNGQGLGTEYEAVVRVTRGKEYIKLILVGGRLKGALLIGETGLEETFENLLLNQLDLTPFGDDILNPDVDIEDYFD